MAVHQDGVDGNAAVTLAGAANAGGPAAAGSWTPPWANGVRFSFCFTIQPDAPLAPGQLTQQIAGSGTFNMRHLGNGVLQVFLVNPDGNLRVLTTGDNQLVAGQPNRLVVRWQASPELFTVQNNGKVLPAAHGVGSTPPAALTYNSTFAGPFTNLVPGAQANGAALELGAASALDAHAVPGIYQQWGVFNAYLSDADAANYAANGRIDLLTPGVYGVTLASGAVTPIDPPGTYGAGSTPSPQIGHLTDVWNGFAYGGTTTTYSYGGPNFQQPFNGIFGNFSVVADLPLNTPQPQPPDPSPAPPPVSTGNANVWRSFFPLAAAYQPSSRFATWRARGINTVAEVPLASLAFPYAETIDQWTAGANANGLRMIRNPRAVFADDIAEPLLLAWSQFDEPELNGVTAAACLGAYAAEKAADPLRPVFLNLSGAKALGLLGGSPPDYPNYFAAADWIGEDIYPVATAPPPNNGNLLLVGQAVDAFTARPGGRPVFAYIETANQGRGNAVGPTPGQVRAEIWSAIIHGARGIFYFPTAYASGSPSVADATASDVATELTAQNAMITALAPILQSFVNPEPLAASVSAPLQVGWRSDANRLQYVFVINMSASTLTAQPVSLQGSAAAATAFVVGENRTVPISGHALVDTFAPFALHIYVFSLDPTWYTDRTLPILPQRALEEWEQAGELGRRGQNRLVPSVYATVQLAMNAAEPGDEIILDHTVDHDTGSQLHMVNKAVTAVTLRCPPSGRTPITMSTHITP